MDVLDPGGFLAFDAGAWARRRSVRSSPPTPPYGALIRFLRRGAVPVPRIFSILRQRRTIRAQSTVEGTS